MDANRTSQSHERFHLFTTRTLLHGRCNTIFKTQVKGYLPLAQVGGRWGPGSENEQETHMQPAPQHAAQLRVTESSVGAGWADTPRRANASAGVQRGSKSLVVTGQVLGSDGNGEEDASLRPRRVRTLLLITHA